MSKTSHQPSFEVVLAVWLMRRLGHARALEDNAVGRSVRNAETALGEIARFEQE